MAALWRFHEFRASGARAGAISEWLNSSDPEISDELSDMLGFLAVTESWARPEFDDVGDGLREIRWRSELLKIQVRIYGIFGPHRRCFTMLIGSTKKGTTHTPRNAKKTAKKRKKAVEGDWSLVEHFEA